MDENLTSHWRSRSSRPFFGGSQFSDAQAARQVSTSIKYGLYPGSGMTRLTSSNLQSSARFSRTNEKAPLHSSLVPDLGRTQVNWRELIGEKIVVQRDLDSSLSDDISTQAVDTPIHSFAALEAGSNPFDLDGLSSNNSSFPGSSFSPWSPQLLVSHTL
jgi:hypothetical protein